MFSKTWSDITLVKCSKCQRSKYRKLFLQVVTNDFQWLLQHVFYVSRGRREGPESPNKVKQQLTRSAQWALRWNLHARKVWLACAGVMYPTRLSVASLNQRSAVTSYQSQDYSEQTLGGRLCCQCHCPELIVTLRYHANRCQETILIIQFVDDLWQWCVS